MGQLAQGNRALNLDTVRNSVRYQSERTGLPRLVNKPMRVATPARGEVSHGGGEVGCSFVVRQAVDLGVSSDEIAQTFGGKILSLLVRRPPVRTRWRC